MRRAVTILASLSLVGVLAFGAAEVIHLRNQVHDLNRAQTQARSAAAVGRLDHATIQSLATQLGDLQAAVAGYERGTAQQQRTTASPAITDAVNQLAADFSRYCTTLDAHLDLSTSIDVEAYCPGSFTLLR